MRQAAVVLLAVAALAATGCRSKVATLRDALLEGDGARAAGLVDVPPCADAGCLDPLARQLGAKNGFNSNDPDQASAGAVALVLSRDRRGDLVRDPDRWQAALTEARGFGADALRIAVARGMAEMAARLGKRIDDDAEIVKTMHDAAGVLPGSCDTYVLLAKAAPEALPPAKRPDHAPCVQRDLERKNGPGAKYGFGVWRAAAAFVALWKDDARALRVGLEYSDEVVRPALEKELAVIEAATAKTEVKKVDGGNAWNMDVAGAHSGVVPGMPVPGASVPPVVPAPTASGAPKAP
jgi:hypothetical protein